MKTDISLVLFLLLTVGHSALQASESSVKPIVFLGDPAPEGGTFRQILSVAMNNSGTIAFTARTTGASGIYLISDGTIQGVITQGDQVNQPELLFGNTPSKKEPTSDPNVILYEFADGHRFLCRTSRAISDFDFFHPLFLSDSGQILFGAGLSGSLDESAGFTHPVFWDGSLTSLFGCPGFRHLVIDESVDFFAKITAAVAGSMNNAGTTLLRLFTIEKGKFAARAFIVAGGSPTPYSSEGVPINVNDSGNLLVSTSQGLFLGSSPVVLFGAPAGDGKTFRSIFGPALNNRNEVVFHATLSDSSRAIFHWAGSILTRLARDGDPIPGGGRFSNIGFVEGGFNDRGELAFASDQGSFLVNAQGKLSKVAVIGDPAPDGAFFTAFGAPLLNNKGQVLFGAALSNGKIGLFLGGTGGLEVEFVDPVPELLAGPAITSDPSALGENGRLVEGIAADGVAQVVIRVKTGEPGTVEFSLVDSEGAPLPASNLNGSLSRVGAAVGSSGVSLETLDIEGIGPMAFAAYHAPMDFSASPNSVEASLVERDIFIKVKLITKNGETVESTEPLTIIRPPVVLVHGLWSTAETWRFFGTLSPRAPDPRVQVSVVEYSGSDAFAPNADILRFRLERIIGDFQNGSNPLGGAVAVVQADIVAHSMGGDVARTMVVRPEFLRDVNFQKGIVHKLITIDTPHLGSHLANRLLGSNFFCKLAFGVAGYPIGGAIRDLAVGSSALRALNERATLGLSTHTIVGIADVLQEQSAEDNFNNFSFGLLGLLCSSLLPRGGFQEVFGGPSDLLVSDDSQAAIGLGLAGASPPATGSANIIHSVIPRLFTLGPDSLSRNIIEGQITGVATPNPSMVIELLNHAARGGTFVHIRP